MLLKFIIKYCWKIATYWFFLLLLLLSFFFISFHVNQFLIRWSQKLHENWRESISLRILPVVSDVLSLSVSVSLSLSRSLTLAVSVCRYTRLIVAAIRQPDDHKSCIYFRTTAFCWTNKHLNASCWQKKKNVPFFPFAKFSAHFA